MQQARFVCFQFYIMASINRINIQSYFETKDAVPLIDVRSPAEFIKGHIPGAINLPLFENEERAKVGTLYKQSGKLNAILKGLEIVGPKQTEIAKRAIKISNNNKLNIHCWRGGMRSESVAWLLSQVGLECAVLEGGYRTYRRYIKSEFSKPWKFIVIGGMTGSGKTDLIQNLAKKNKQIIDLEELANHKGSAFGGIGKGNQPSTEQFENNLYEEFLNLEINQEIWIEDESKSVGRVNIPDEIFLNMRKSQVVEIKMNKEWRIQRLVKEYARLNTEHLTGAILRIQKRLGGDNTKTCLKAVENGDFEKAIELVLMYYDKAYQKGLTFREIKSIQPFQIASKDFEENAELLLEYYKTKIKK